MQVQSTGGSMTIPGQPHTNIFAVAFATKGVVEPSSRGILRGDYPCGCRRCREAAAAAEMRPNTLASIDVYELPDGVECESTEYFH